MILNGSSIRDTSRVLNELMTRDGRIKKSRSSQHRLNNISNVSAFVSFSNNLAVLFKSDICNNLLFLKKKTL